MSLSEGSRLEGCARQTFGLSYFVTIIFAMTLRIFRSRRVIFVALSLGWMGNWKALIDMIPSRLTKNCKIFKLRILRYRMRYRNSFIFIIVSFQTKDVKKWWK